MTREPVHLTVSEAADRLRCRDETVLRYLRNGLITGALVGGRYLIHVDEIERLLVAPPANMSAARGPR